MHDRPFSMHPLFQLTASRVREFSREPEAVFWVFIFPVLLALALGIAFRARPPESSSVVVEEKVEGAGRIAALLADSGELRVTLMPAGESFQALRLGKAEVVVAPGGEAEPYTFIYDPTRPESRVARLLAEKALQAGLGRKDVVTIGAREVVSPGARYIDFLIPGLIGMNLMGSGMWGIGFNVVQARSKKLLKRIVATPVPRSYFLLSYMLSRLVFLFFEVAALVAFGRLVFDFQVSGSYFTLAAVTLLGAMSFAGLGLLVASRSTSIEAVSGWMNFVMLPMWMLSGSFFAYTRFPEFTHPFIRALPLTAVNDALRAIMNEGASLASISFELAVMAAWGALSFVVAVKVFRWQ